MSGHECFIGMYWLLLRDYKLIRDSKIRCLAMNVLIPAVSSNSPHIYVLFLRGVNFGSKIIRTQTSQATVFIIPFGLVTKQVWMLC